MPFSFPFASLLLRAFALSLFSVFWVAKIFAFSSGMAIFSQRRITPTFPPHFRQYGGAPHASRRFYRHKIRHAAALLVLPARQDGDNFAHAANFNAIRNIQPSKSSARF